jgi:hypothetical protein
MTEYTELVTYKNMINSTNIAALTYWKLIV